MLFGVRDDRQWCSFFFLLLLMAFIVSNRGGPHRNVQFFFQWLLSGPKASLWLPSRLVCGTVGTYFPMMGLPRTQKRILNFSEDRYSHLSNNPGGWNKHVGVQKLQNQLDFFHQFFCQNKDLQLKMTVRKIFIEY